MKAYDRYNMFVFFFVFVVIAAGSIVRMSQSGMGCPDWPTCFGLWIPPLTEADLPPDYLDYLGKQDIDHSFNVYHTWIEYINRLLGALLGIIVLIHFVWSVRLFGKSRRAIAIASFFMLCLVIFEAWLGKLVVDGNLEVNAITYHMLGALFLGIIPLLIRYRLRERNVPVYLPKLVIRLFMLLGILLLVQIILGTQVREEIDIISKALDYGHRDLWIDRLGSSFIVHRSFTWLPLLLSSFLVYRLTKLSFLRVRNMLIGIVFVILLTALGMVYIGMPALLQPTHLIIATIFFNFIFYVLFKFSK